MKKFSLITALVFCLSSLSACSMITKNNINVHQGNLIKTKQVNRLKIGMSKNQVAAIMGSTVYKNTFDNNRWIYVNTSQVNGGERIIKRVILSFRQNRLRNIQRS